jgi:hypothetical protein
MAFDKVMLSNLYLINGASKRIASFTIMNVSLFVYIYTLMLYMKLDYFLHIILI